MKCPPDRSDQEDMSSNRKAAIEEGAAESEEAPVSIDLTWTPTEQQPGPS